MSSSENNGIIENRNKSCSYLAIQRIAETGIEAPQKAFRHHIENTKKLGLMPDDFKVLKKTLSYYGFVMQNTRLEDISIEQVLAILGELGAPATIFLSVGSYANLGGYMLAIRTDGKHGYNFCCAAPKPKCLESLEVTHVWIRWDDGVDRSPYPRKALKHRSTGNKARTYKDTEAYRHFQPNPCGNHIGDCVVRGLAGALNISWNEAMDRLSSAGETTVNTRNVYSKILEYEGFVWHKPMVKDGRRLTGKAFCLEMGRLYHNGEHIFAHVGRSHVAAIIPTEGNSKYKIIDSWDSSAWLIGEYWVIPVKKSSSAAKTKSIFCEPFAIGDTLRHPSLGVGIVTDTIPGVVTIDFGVKGSRRLGAAWALKNCPRTAA